MGKNAEIKLESAVNDGGSERICEGQRQEGRKGTQMKGRATGHNTARCYLVKLGGVHLSVFNMIPESRLSSTREKVKTTPSGSIKSSELLRFSFLFFWLNDILT